MKTQHAPITTNTLVDVGGIPRHLADTRRLGTHLAICGTLVRRTVAFSNLGIDERTGKPAMLCEQREMVTCPECTAAMVASRITGEDEHGKPVEAGRFGLYDPVRRCFQEWEGVNVAAHLKYGDIIDGKIVVKARGR